MNRHLHVRSAAVAAVLYAFFLTTCSGPGGRSTDSAILAGELRSHVEYLASDELGGRRAGTPEGERAARYIAREFKRYGLEGMGDGGGFLQAFTFVADVTLGRGNSFMIIEGGEEPVLNEDWRPLAFSADGDGSYEVVFAGYGISAPGEDYDDYTGLDVEGKAVLVIPYGPMIEGGGMHFPAYHALRRKASIARDRGAAALLVAPHPAVDPADFLEPLRYDSSPSSSGIIVASITLETARALIGDRFDLEERVRDIDTSMEPASAELGSGTHLSVNIEPVERTGHNVAGAVTGAGEGAPWVVIGAHFDHLGMGGDGSLAPDTVAVHNGADDNGSGTAGVLELAQAFASDPPANRNILFVAFDAEELGLLGSSYFVSHLPEEVGRPETMVNMDMIGRMTDEKLTVYGTGTSAEWDQMLTAANDRDGYGFELSMIPDGYGSSDHSSFYAKEIPVLAFFTGTHMDYHRPSDDADKVNYEGEERIVRYIHDLVSSWANRTELIAFQPAAEPVEQRGGRMGFSVYTGVVPDFSYQGEGFAISGVNDGSPAATAGLEGGDVILRWGERPVNNIYDYMYAMQDGSPGQRVVMEVKRGNRTFTVQVVLGNSRTRRR